MHGAKVRKILWITFAWILLSAAQFGHTYGAMASLGHPIPNDQARIMLSASLFSGLLAGLTGGALIIYFFNYWLRHRSYGEALLRIFVSFTIVFIGISIITGFLFYSQDLGFPPGHPEVVKKVFAFFVELDTIRTYFFWLFVVLATNITLLVDEKYGPGVFRDFLLGKYFRPRREERIFMFLDLRGSTTMAEQLGEEPYFLLIQELFRDVTPSILKHRGQIYQYVGDEIVINWPLQTGLHQGQCVKCFLDIQQLLRDRAEYYKQKYGQQPEFKAGLHYGHVMAGEVGVVKREIAFSGDVLNTTARIQSKCNDMGVNLLLSEKLVEVLPLNIREKAQALGEILLRGKIDQVMVYTLS